jgi:hypothetical protein
MERFKFYFHSNKEFIYSANLTEFDGKIVYMVMWVDNDELEGTICMKNDVDELIEKGKWVVIEE